MVQLRSGIGGGGGGGGFQSLDYGFRQNPSTGKCHLTPPTIPMGCGRKILEMLHVEMATFAALMILQTLIALAAVCLAGYSFFFWLEKEVIVIPEDEVSNLIILEPESSTTMSEGGNLEGSGIRSGYYPGNEGGGGGEYLGSSRASGSRGPSYLGSSTTRGPSNGGSGSGYPPTGVPTGYYPDGSGSGPGGPPGTVPGSGIPPGSNKTGLAAAGVGGVPTSTGELNLLNFCMGVFD